MKNILFLILICVIKLSAYEYYIRSNTGNGILYYNYFTNEGGILRLHVMRKNTEDSQEIILNNNLMLPYLSGVRSNLSSEYISNETFKGYYKNDFQFLNDLYITDNFTRNAILNYFYNPNYFELNNYIDYTNYELLYNSDGLVVESIVNGDWAGLYSDSEKSSSGYLYNSGGTLIYYNGEKVSWIQSAIDKVIQGVIGNLHTMIRLISTPVGVCVSVVFALCLVYYVVEVGRRAIKPFDGKVRKRFLEPKN